MFGTSGNIPGVFYQVTISQICNLTNGNFPMYALAVAVSPLAYSSQCMLLFFILAAAPEPKAVCGVSEARPITLTSGKLLLGKMHNLPLRKSHLLKCLWDRVSNAQ